MDVRAREVYKKSYTSEYRPYPDWVPWTDTLTLTGVQRTESEGHPFSRIGKTGEDIGGNFQTERWYAPKPAATLTTWGWRKNRWREGAIWPSQPDTLFRTGQPFASDWSRHSHVASADLMAQRGATAISRVIPTNPAFSAAAAIGELRAGLPSLPGKTALKAMGRPKGFAGEYLNLEFAIKPTLSDGRKLVEAHKKSEKILAQLYRDSGRLVRRRYSFPPEVEKTTERVTGVYPWGSFVDDYNFGRGTLERTTTTTRKFWFSGAFTYFFPKQEGWHRKIAELEKVYGVIPDAADLYQLTPWSWAVDWVSNTGDLVQNMTSFSQDSLVLRFGYIMCHTTYEVTETWTGPVMSNDESGAFRTRDLTTSWRYVSKQRQKATPYGFGLDTDGFTLRQKAIIAALGISMGSRR